LEPADGAIAAPGADVMLKPALASPRQVERTGLALRAGETEGAAATFTYRLEPGWTLAFRTTRLAPGRWPGEPREPVRTPVRELAPLYVSAGVTVAGEVPDATDDVPTVRRWPALVFTR
jgi:hypothetical protein